MFIVSFRVASSLQNGQDSIKFSTTLTTTLRIKTSHEHRCYLFPLELQSRN
jgi:hypothetical protein